METGKIMGHLAKPAAAARPEHYEYHDVAKHSLPAGTP